MSVTLRRSVFLVFALTAAAAHAEEPEGCPGLIASAPPLVLRASLARDEVGLTFIGHSTFLIETPQGVRIATDYNDYVRAPAVPRIATMNKAHSTHFSRAPDPGIEHVLRGWNPAGGPARHDLTVGDVRVRNVSTNIRDYGGNTEYDGNSIFVFETTQLCIAHLGHLHHTLTPEHLKKLGRIDVLLVPVDGGYTMHAFDMMEVLRSINARLMLPMHYFNPSMLERFLSSAREHFPVEFSDKASITISRETLPRLPKILVLPGR
jgi:L-ascorbate metabolism protein UlaG (beta-lactamase superfamily)